MDPNDSLRNLRTGDLYATPVLNSVDAYDQMMSLQIGSQQVPLRGITPGSYMSGTTDPRAQGMNQDSLLNPVGLGSRDSLSARPMTAGHRMDALVPSEAANSMSLSYSSYGIDGSKLNRDKPLELRANYTLHNFLVVGSVAFDVTRITSSDRSLPVGGTGMAQVAADEIGRAAAEPVTRGEICVHLQTNPIAIMYLEGLVSSREGQFGQVGASAITAIHNLAQESTAHFLLLNRTIRYFCCSAPDVWEKMSADVVNELFKAFSRMLSSQDSLVFAEASIAARIFVSRNGNALEAVARRSTQSPDACSTFAGLVSAMLEALKKVMWGIGIAHRGGVGIGWMENGDVGAISSLSTVQWSVGMLVEAVPKDFLKVQVGTTGRHEDVGALVIFDLTEHLHFTKNRRAGRALQVLQLLVDGTCAEACLTRHPQPGALIVALAHCMRSQIELRDTQLSAPLAEQARRILETLTGPLTLGSWISNPLPQGPVEAAMQEVVCAVLVLQKDAAKEGGAAVARTGVGMLAEEAAVLQTLTESVYNIVVRAPKDVLMKLGPNGTLYNLIEASSQTMSCEIALAHLAVKTVNVLAHYTNLAAYLKIPEGLTARETLITNLCLRCFLPSQSSTNENINLMGQALETISSLLVGDELADELLDVLLGDPTQSSNPLMSSLMSFFTPSSLEPKTKTAVDLFMQALLNAMDLHNLALVDKTLALLAAVLMKPAGFKRIAQQPPQTVEGILRRLVALLGTKIKWGDPYNGQSLHGEALHGHNISRHGAICLYMFTCNSAGLASLNQLGTSDKAGMVSHLRRLQMVRDDPEMSSAAQRTLQNLLSHGDRTWDSLTVMQGQQSRSFFTTPDYKY
eukprot:gene3278-4129_t